MHVSAALLLAGILLAAGWQAEARVTDVAQHTVYEASFESTRDYADPARDVRVTVEFSSPACASRTVSAFWDGGRAWRVRFAPDRAGEWTWRSECSAQGDPGLHGRQGNFRCVPYRGSNPIYSHGPVGLSRDRHHFLHSDGTPFLWLADTAWNGVLKANPADWRSYLSTRWKQGFTAVQFVSTHWRALHTDVAGQAAYTGGKGIRVSPDFFRRLDGKVADINRQGLVAAPVMLWALGHDSPGLALSEDDAVHLARYIAARWGAYQVIWILGGDGEYSGEKCERWKRIGRAVFGAQRDRLVTMHPCGQSWVAREFGGETWIDFIGYQSGHGDSAGSLKWLTTGPPAREWNRRPTRPVINLEPNYEAHLAYQSRQPIDAHKVRRALYWSLLIAPPAGVTYGHHGIWFWAEKREVPLNHSGSGEAPPWHEAVRSEGAASVRHLRTLLDLVEWWKLRPAQDLLHEQPGDKDPARFIAAAKSTDGRVAVVYTPAGGRIALRTEKLSLPAAAEWFDPRGGKRARAGDVTAPECRFDAPDEGDWALVVRFAPD